MSFGRILKLGNPLLYERSLPVLPEEIPSLMPVAEELLALIDECRRVHGFGRGIAAPQIGVMKRLVCLHLDKPYILFNPQLTNMSEGMFEMWDDCMCFPGLLVKVKRHIACTLTYTDEHGEENVWQIENDISELLQHEVDHLDGILATQRAVDDKSLRFK